MIKTILTGVAIIFGVIIAILVIYFLMCLLDIVLACKQDQDEAWLCPYYVDREEDMYDIEYTKLDNGNTMMYWKDRSGCIHCKELKNEQS